MSCPPSRFEKATASRSTSQAISYCQTTASTPCSPTSKGSVSDKSRSKEDLQNEVSVKKDRRDRPCSGGADSSSLVLWTVWRDRLRSHKLRQCSAPLFPPHRPAQSTAGDLHQVLNQYNLAMQMSKNIPNMASRYRASWAPWRYASTQDIYGNATPWVNGANSGAVPTVLGGLSPGRPAHFNPTARHFCPPCRQVSYSASESDSAHNRTRRRRGTDCA